MRISIYTVQYTSLYTDTVYSPDFEESNACVRAGAHYYVSIISSVAMDAQDNALARDYWRILSPDVLMVVLAPLPAVDLARLQCTCVALRDAARTTAARRFVALRPPELEHGRDASDPATHTRCLHWLEGCQNCVLALGGFDTSRLPAGTPDDDQHDDAGCLADVELLYPSPERPHDAARFPAIAPMDVRRADLATVSLGGGWIFAVGGRCGARDHSSVARLDLGTGRWEDVEPMVVPLSGCSAAPLGPSRFLVAGGAWRSSWRATSLVQVYDARSEGDSWRIATEMSQFRYFSAAVAVTPSVSVDQATIAPSVHTVAVLGGVSHTGAQMGSNQEPNVYRPRLVELYDGGADVWSSGPSLLAARYGCAAAILPRSGRVAALGGTDEMGERLREHSVEALDLRAPTGVALARLPVGLWGAAAVALASVPGRSESIMCLGGCVAQPSEAGDGIDAGEATNSVSVANCYIYDEVADKWRGCVEGETMATPRWCGSATLCRA